MSEETKSKDWHTGYRIGYCIVLRDEWWINELGLTGDRLEGFHAGLEARLKSEEENAAH
jgi:hypothetical protein